MRLWSNWKNKLRDSSRHFIFWAMAFGFLGMYIAQAKDKLLTDTTAPMRTSEMDCSVAENIHSEPLYSQAAYENRCRELMDTYVAELRSQRSEQQTEVDRQILTLSSALLALSMTFIKDLVPINAAVCFPLLFVAWFFLASSIVGTLLSFYLSQITYDKYIDSAPRFYEQEERNAFAGAHDLAKKTTFANLASCICFLIGFISLVFFAGVNFYHARHPTHAAQPKRENNPTKLKSLTDKTSNLISYCRQHEPIFGIICN